MLYPSIEVQELNKGINSTFFHILQFSLLVLHCPHCVCVDLWPEFFLLVDLRDFFPDLGSGVWGG